MKASAVIKRPSTVRANVSRCGGASVTVDPALDPTSTNPVENKAIVEALALKADLEDIPTAVSELTNDAGYVNATQAANAAPVQSVNSKTGAVVLDATDVGALPDTTTFALGYDPDCSVGLAEVGDAVTDEPFYTPSGTVNATLNWEYKNNKLYIYGVNTTFTGNGVKFAVEQEN